MLAAGSLLVFGQAKNSDNASVEKTLMQMERDWSQAYTNKDVKTLDKILAEDWEGVDFTGKHRTKAQAVEELRSGKASAQSFELGPLKVRIFGDIAVVNGSQVEKSSYENKDTSGKYFWTTVYANRNDHWQAVATQGTKVEE